ncbi:hypothetical protein D3C73_838240 [compost metagenome]
MIAVKGPAVEPDAGFAIGQILRVQQELVFGFLDIFRTVEQHADLGERQHAHHQRIIPHLLVIDAVVDDVLQAAFTGTRHFIHHPVSPAFQIGNESVVARVLVEIGERQERCDGVDVLGRSPFGQARLEPVIDDRKRIFVRGQLVILEQTIKTDAVGPFPTCPTLGVDDPAVFKAQEKFARFIFNIDQIIRQTIDQLTDFVTSDEAFFLLQKGMHSQRYFPPEMPDLLVRL